MAKAENVEAVEVGDRRDLCLQPVVFFEFPIEIR